MTGQIILALIVALPVLLGFLFRVSASHLFFSLMAGELLARYFGHDLDMQAILASQPQFFGYGEIVLLVVPMLLTSFFLRKTISSGKTLLHLVPFAITGIMFAAFLVPILPIELQNQIKAFSIGEWLMNLNKVIIGGMIVLQLVALWLFNHKDFKRKNRKDK